MHTLKETHEKVHLLYLAGLVNPRVHGNGFIQLDIADGQRLHIWGDSRIPKQVSPMPIHDHSFSFVSRVLIGRMINIEYVTLFKDHWNNPTHYVCGYTAALASEDTKLYRMKPEPVKVYALGCTVVSPKFDRAQYTFNMRQLHETIVDEPTATIMTKTDRDPTYKARVLCPIGAEPDNSFDREQFNIEDLWRIIFDVLER